MRIRFLLLICISILTCCKQDLSKSIPILTTDEVSQITDISAVSGGLIISDGGESVTERGVLWSINPSPTINEGKTIDGAGGGKFVSTLVNLAPATSYFVRAYAINKNGIGFGITYNFKTKEKQILPPTITTDQALEKLTKTWKVTSVTLDGTAVTTPSYSAFQLVMTGTKGASLFGYTTSGRPSLSPWKASGSWSFVVGQQTSLIIRDPDNIIDQLAIAYVVTDNTLEISFNYNGAGYVGRTDQVKGNWVFKFGL